MDERYWEQRARDLIAAIPRESTASPRSSRRRAFATSAAADSSWQASQIPTLARFGLVVDGAAIDALSSAHGTQSGQPTPADSASSPVTALISIDVRQPPRVSPTVHIRSPSRVLENRVSKRLQDAWLLPNVAAMASLSESSAPGGTALEPQPEACISVGSAVGFDWLAADRLDRGPSAPHPGAAKMTSINTIPR